MCPVDPTPKVVSGGTINLNVYAAAVDSPWSRTEIRWFNPRGELIVGDSRVSLNNSNQRLLVQNAGLADSGTYRVDIYRVDIARPVSIIPGPRILAETTVELNVHGE